MKRLSQLTGIAPLLWAVYPVLFLYGRNTGLVSIENLYRPLLAMTALGLFIPFITKRFIHNHTKAAVIGSLFFIFIFIYDPLIHHFINPYSTDLEGFRIRHRYIIPFYLLLFLMTIWCILRSRRPLNRLAQGLTLAGLVLIGLSGLTIAVHTCRLSSATANPYAPVSPVMAGPSAPPNVFYIILDEYAHHEVLKEIFDYDNSNFLAALQQLGFYVPSSSTTNYCYTRYSLASSLNMSYLNDFTQKYGTDTRDYSALVHTLKNNAVFDAFRHNGYEIVSFATGYMATEITTADRYISHSLCLNEFESQLVNMTILPALNSFLNISFVNALSRYRINSTLRELPQWAHHDQPVFVFAHLLCPHLPFAFGPHGESIPEGEFTGDTTERNPLYIKYYRNQVQFISSAILETIKNILAQSTHPPIIILQSDHGSRNRLQWTEGPNPAAVQEAFPILNAYYFPDQDYSRLYHSITPVNSFRVVMNQFWGTDLPLLPDRNYFADTKHVYNFQDITAIIHQK